MTLSIPNTPEGWRQVDELFQTEVVRINDLVPGWTSEVDLVLPYLKGRQWNSWTQGLGAATTYFAIYPEKGETGYSPSCADTLARAMVLALLRLKGHVVEIVA